jgi:hypothetical protein
MGLFVIVVYHFRSRGRHIPDRDLPKVLGSIVEIRACHPLLTVAAVCSARRVLARLDEQ